MQVYAENKRRRIKLREGEIAPPAPHPRSTARVMPGVGLPAIASKRSRQRAAEPGVIEISFHLGRGRRAVPTVSGKRLPLRIEPTFRSERVADEAFQRQVQIVPEQQGDRVSFSRRRGSGTMTGNPSSTGYSCLHAGRGQ